MELKDIDEEKDGRGKTPDRLEASGQQPRRGSNLLAAAGIGYENRRRLSQQQAEAQGRVFQEGKNVCMQMQLQIFTINLIWLNVHNNHSNEHSY